MWKFKSWKGKDKYLFLLSVGVMLCILAFPAERLTGFGKTEEGRSRDSAGSSETAAAETGIMEADAAEAGTVGASAGTTYEKYLEKRVAEILSHVDGVGAVDVMIVLKTSAEKVIHVDTSSSRSSEEEKDNAGGIRKNESDTQNRETVLTESESGRNPVIEKEIYPEISGIIVSAAGGGNPTVRSEISAAMEALFGLPAHKIKVLKRVE